MTNVIPLQPKAADEPNVWTCGKCGCQTFYLYSNDTTECALCGSHDIESRGRWLETLKDDETVPEDIPPRIDIVYGSEDFARKSVMRDAGAHSAAVVVLQKDGSIRVWSAIGKDDSENRQHWFKQMLQAAAALAFGERADTDKIPD